MRGGGCEFEERPQSGTGATAGAQLEHLPEQHQRDDHRGGLEVDRCGLGREAKRGRDDLGRDGRRGAVEPSGRYPQGDQGEHVEVAAAKRRDTPREERRPTVEHHRKTQRELDPAEQTAVAAPAERHLAHRHRDQWHRRHRAHDQATRHVALFLAGLVHRRDTLVFEPHPANGTRAGAVLDDLGMHRTGVLHSRGSTLARSAPRARALRPAIPPGVAAPRLDHPERDTL